MGKTNKQQKKAAALKEKGQKSSVQKINSTTIQKKKNKGKRNNAFKTIDKISEQDKIQNKNTKHFVRSCNTNANNASLHVINTDNTKQLQAINNKSRKKKVRKGKIRLDQVNNKDDDTVKKIQNVKKITEKKVKHKKGNTATPIDRAKLVNKNSMKTKKNSKINIERLKQMLATKEKDEVKPKKIKEILPLRERMMMKLKASRFRYLNETLYNNSSTQSKKYFKEDPDAFKAYHDGYKQQVEQWPLNPLDVMIESIKNMPNDRVIADFGCGEALLAASVPQKVHSFDLISVNERVRACDMAHTPLLTSSTHVVVFCLSLMGTNLGDYILEANRVLKKDGILKIAEIESRFDQIDDFIKILNDYGFINTWKDLSQNLFYFLDFKKVKDITTNRNKLPEITLKSCIYKKR
ncbi:hypothetical protein KPH14_003243 [Odynerus spinipes]|uniref:Ribosomal RNA-processing protein 8 n=1 Tax=Odynerus spinipes TaxID=1348599 RepID=A0AAD9VM05_9HYME|nr:hypothetical protein KPH14_003243 [Odynerus spinipes]